jgi:dTDP-4-dehydrorhamnose reductase
MRVLILGGDGMMGHQLYRFLRTGHEVRVTLRQREGDYARFNLFEPAAAYYGIEVTALELLQRVVGDSRPQVVVNCVGIVKQRPTAREAIPSIAINALLPHQLAQLCEQQGARLVHLSTDCVFSGRKGNYREDDFPDANDLYGRTKLLGEVCEPHCLTLRTSIIGWELSRKKSLLEWLVAQSGTIKGFTKAIYSGFSTMEMARIIERMIREFPAVSGIYQVSSEPISKYDLLVRMNERLGLGLEIEPDDQFFCDRSLDSTRFRKEFDYTPPTWETMLGELCDQYLVSRR